MTPTVVSKVCCPEPGNQDLPFGFLIYHTFVSAKQVHLDDFGVRSGQEVISMPPKLFLFVKCLETLASMFFLALPV